MKKATLTTSVQIEVREAQKASQTLTLVQLVSYSEDESSKTTQTITFFVHPIVRNSTDRFAIGQQNCLTTIACVNHLIPSRTQK